MKSIFERIQERAACMEQEGRLPLKVYLGSEQLRDLQRATYGQHGSGPRACEHCGLHPRQRVLGLDIYLVDAKSHIQVA